MRVDDLGKDPDQAMVAGWKGNLEEVDTYSMSQKGLEKVAGENYFPNMALTVEKVQTDGLRDLAAAETTMAAVRVFQIPCVQN